jgi:type II secretory pathway pseudopilin PulG
MSDMSQARRMIGVGIVLMVFGVAAAFTISCTNYQIAVNEVPENQTSDGYLITYENLSQDQKRVFERAVDDEGAYVDANSTRFNFRQVQYSDAYYSLSTPPNNCLFANAVRLLGLVLLVSGVLLAIIGRHRYREAQQ